MNDLFEQHRREFDRQRAQLLKNANRAGCLASIVVCAVLAFYASLAGLVCVGIAAGIKFLLQ